MSRLSQVPRVKLTQDDRSILVNIATLYEQADGLYTEAKGISKVELRALARANKARSAAVWDLMEWANRRLTDPLVPAGYPEGSNYPRMKKLYDASWDHRKWGAAGCAREAAKAVRAVVKRGWL